MVTVVLVRHGQSVWNKRKLFTGWVDVDLTLEGIREAEACGELLQDWCFDEAFTSPMRRALHTFDVIRHKNKHRIPVTKTWRLNERHYGALEGENKPEMVQRVGEAQVLRWRRSWAVRPPAITKDDKRFKQQVKDFPEAEQPLTESLSDCVMRVLPYWYEKIVPELKQGKTVLIVAHGNSLRGLVKMFDDLSNEAITGVEIPTGAPLIYELDEHNNLRTKKKYYLGKNIQERIEGVKNQIK